MTSTFIPTAPLQTAVLFLVFNRPDTTAQVFKAIRKAKPLRLYIAADGPRSHREGEAEKVAMVREIATAVDWKCEVKTLFRKENLGCKCAVSGGITWFFEHEEQGIILEDDCLPHIDFFHYCEELLDHYVDDVRVSVITGNNYQNNQVRGNASYYFSRYPHCWGWATWRRSWILYQGDLLFWPDWRGSDDWINTIPDRVERRYWERIFNRVYIDEIDSWAYPWTASVWYYHGLTVTPNVNLVSNIGFGEGATHTTSMNKKQAALPTKAIGDLSHPNKVQRNITADKFTFSDYFGGKFLQFPFSLFRSTIKVARIVYHNLKMHNRFSH